MVSTFKPTAHNFLQTVDHALESRIDWEHFTVNREEHRTVVKPFPISVEFPESPAPPEAAESTYMERVALLRELGVEAAFLGRGRGSRGLYERDSGAFPGHRTAFRKAPELPGKFTFVQIGAPSRTHIKRYHDLLAGGGVRSRAYQLAVPDEQVETHRLHETAAHPPGNPAVLPDCGSLPGHFSARWHEPGGEGVCSRTAG